MGRELVIKGEGDLDLEEVLTVLGGRVKAGEEEVDEFAEQLLVLFATGERKEGDEEEEEKEREGGRRRCSTFYVFTFCWVCCRRRAALGFSSTGFRSLLLFLTICGSSCSRGSIKLDSI